jgi:hypothetical protein
MEVFYSSFLRGSTAEPGLSPILRNRTLGLAWEVIPAENTPAKKLVRRKSMGTILIIILVLLLVGALPTWPYSGGWGYYPSGGLGLVLLIVIVLALTGRV